MGKKGLTPIELSAVCLLALLAGCATHYEPLRLPKVGPAPGSHSRGPEGNLQVFTRTLTHNDGGTLYYPHTEYRIYRPDDSFVKLVRNHTTLSDQRPELVRLPAGEYYLVAAADSGGVVRVPFVIMGSQVTVITLDGTRVRAALNARPEEIVTLPNGAFVGWRARD